MWPPCSLPYLIMMEVEKNAPSKQGNWKICSKQRASCDAVRCFLKSRAVSVIYSTGVQDKKVYLKLKNLEDKMKDQSPACLWELQAKHEQWAAQSWTHFFFYAQTAMNFYLSPPDLNCKPTAANVSTEASAQRFAGIYFHILIHNSCMLTRVSKNNPNLDTPTLPLWIRFVCASHRSITGGLEHSSHSSDNQIQNQNQLNFSTTNETDLWHLLTQRVQRGSGPTLYLACLFLDGEGLNFTHQTSPSFLWQRCVTYASGASSKVKPYMCPHSVTCAHFKHAA